ncbi:MAG: glycoside hydrolase family 55 protein [Candidatus Goldbacteria bacterium]|nr:glycoside hydrolase family 55 protein [Candidatus Goldiibacteriota bacterium]
MIIYIFGSIIPPEQSIDWTNVGCPDEKIKIENTINIKDFGAKGDGITDDSSAFTKAIYDAKPKTEIFIPEGVYILNSPIRIYKSLILRGAGKDKTKLIFNFNNSPSIDAITIGPEGKTDWIEVIDGFQKGSKTLEVKDGSIFSPGVFVEIEQDNDPKKMYTDPQWNQSWAQNVIGQIFQVLSTTGNKITVDEPLHIDFNKSFNPRIRILYMTTGVAIEDLFIKRFDRGDGNIITIKNSAYCRIKNIESEYVYRTHVSIERSYRCSVLNSYFHHAHDYGGGGHGYGVEIKHHACNNLVENNKFYHLRHSMMVHLGANANVFGYNESKEPYATSDHTPGTVICDISIHGHYPFMNLFEGNKVAKIEFSDWWGPCGPGNTLYKNIVTDENIIIRDKTLYQNIIGNIIEKGRILIYPPADKSSLLIMNNIESGQGSIDKNLPKSLYKIKK